MGPLDNIKMESVKSCEGLRKLLTTLQCGLSDDIWIKDYLHNFGTLYYRDSFNGIQFLLVHYAVHKHLQFDAGCVVDLNSCQMGSKSITAYWWCEMQMQFHA